MPEVIFMLMTFTHLPTVSSMEAQIEVVSRFTAENFLKLNEGKCEVIICRNPQVKPQGAH